MMKFLGKIVIKCRSGNRKLLIDFHWPKVGFHITKRITYNLLDTGTHFSLFSIHKLREEVHKDDTTLKKKELESGPKASYGYGGKFGVEKDRMDKVSCSDNKGLINILKIRGQNTSFIFGTWVRMHKRVSPGLKLVPD